MSRYRYSRWDGTQQVFPVREDDLMSQLSQHLMSQGDVSVALRSLMQRGVQGSFGQHVPGVQEMLQRLRDRKQELLAKYNLSSALDDISKKLDDVVDTERKGITRRLEEMRDKRKAAADKGEDTSLADQLLRRAEERAEHSRQALDQLPKEPGERIRQLSDYEFTDPEAKEKFDKLVDSLRRSVLDRIYQDMSQRLKRVTPRTAQTVKEMLRDLNNLLEHPAGGTREAFQRFMQKYAPLMGPNPPSNLEELMDKMRQQMAQMESMLKSLSQVQRQELEGILGSLFQDDELRSEMARLAANMASRGPLGSLGREFGFRGDDPLTLEEALLQMRDLHAIEELERQIRRAQQGNSLSDVDLQLLAGALGEDAMHEFEQLQELASVLEQAGYIRQVGNRYELTPRGVRKIGQKALHELFRVIKRDRVGHHAAPVAGAGGDPTDETKSYEFGDAFSVDIRASTMNALRRHPGTPVRLMPQDFEVRRMEQTAHTSTILMLDLSLSMAMRGNFLAAKKVGLALDNLIRTQFPRDTLQIVGFSTYAREVRPDKLAYLTWDEFDPYTNIQQGLELARKLLARSPSGNRQIILISDGEPTAHVEAGQLFLQYPPSPRTLTETLREVQRCTRLGIIINTFMLERSAYLLEFVDQMTRINRGRVFYTSPERLGEYILVDYLASRRQLLA